jgi:hypothetical protein
LVSCRFGLEQSDIVAELGGRLMPNARNFNKRHKSSLIHADAKGMMNEKIDGKSAKEYMFESLSVFYNKN